MTQRRALGDLDFDSAFDDPDNGWFGHFPAADPTSSRAHDDRPRDSDFEAAVETPSTAPDAYALDGTEDTDRWPALTLDAAPPPAVVDERVDDAPGGYVPDPAPAGEPAATRWSDDPPPVSPSWESRLSGSGAWDFKVAASGARRYQPKFALAAVITAGLVVAGVLLFIRSPGTADDESPVVDPSRSTAQPAPASTPPASTAPSLDVPSQPPLPPGPPGPPPPPPTAEELSPPVVTRDYTPRRQNTPDDSSKPEIGVTRAPATRTQMSATPPLPGPPPGRNSGTPGDSNRRGGFGFGF